MFVSINVLKIPGLYLSTRVLLYFILSVSSCILSVSSCRLHFIVIEGGGAVTPTHPGKGCHRQIVILSRFV